MQIHWSVPFFPQIRESANIFDKIQKLNVNATVTSNFAQIVKKITCLMTITQYNSNNSLTPEFKWAFLKKEIIWMNSITYRPRLNKNLWSKFRLWPKIKHQDRHNPESTGKIYSPIHDPQCFPNPRIRLIYSKNPQSARFLRPNPSIRKPIHPLTYVHSWLFL